MESPHQPRDDEVAGLDQRRCDEGQSRGDDEDDDEGAMHNVFVLGVGGSGRTTESRDAEPATSEIDGDSRILNARISQQSEDVEGVVSVIS